MSSLVAGFDSSTQATKVVIVDVDTGEIRAQGRADHEVTGVDGARESDPRQWWQALGAALAQTGLAGRVEAASVAAQQHGLVTLGASGQPLRPAILWNDTRSAPDVAALIESLGGRARWAHAACSVPVAAFTVGSWAWLRRHEPEVARQTRGIRLPHDYLTERLTGEAVTDRGDASGTGWWSPSTDAYLDDVLELPEVALERSLLPRVLGPAESAGALSAVASEHTGLPVGIPVGPGTGDNMAAALGLGLAVGQVAMSLGTSGTVFAPSSTPTMDTSGVIAGFADASGAHLPLACTLNCTLAIDRIAALLGIDREAAAPATTVVMLPYLDGERTPDLPYAAGTLLGVRHATEPGEILLAAYQGAVASLLEAVDRIAGHGAGITSDSPILLIGGGARGLTWQRVVSELSGHPVMVPEPAQFVALGAAAQAAALITGDQPDALGRRWSESRRRTERQSQDPNIEVRERISAAIAQAGMLYPAPD